jgi:hypothetical protein
MFQKVLEMFQECKNLHPAARAHPVRINALGDRYVQAKTRQTLVHN